jgi:hypothetical protein
VGDRGCHKRAPRREGTTQRQPGKVPMTASWLTQRSATGASGR